MSEPDVNRDPAAGRGAEASRRRKFLTLFRIINVRLRFILLMVLTGLIAGYWGQITAHWERWTRPGETAVTEAVGEYEYYCGMHPSVVRSEPGNCPICGMPLSQRKRGEAPALPEGVSARVQFSPYRIQLAGIGTSEVGYRTLSQSLRTVGTIEADERRVAHIASRVPGRIEQLHVDFTGERVAAGAPLVELYSPEILSTEQEYLMALRAARAAGEGPDAGAAAEMGAVLAATRERLRLWGLADDQITALERSGPESRTTIRSPSGGIVTRKNVLAGQYVMEGTELYTVADFSRVWMTAFVQEGAIERVRIGQPVEVRASAFPERVFAGEVSFVWPVLERETRSLRVRVDIPNPGLALRPGMYVDASIDVSPARPPAASADAAASAGRAARYVCPMHPEVVSDAPGTCPKCGMLLERQEVAPAGATLAVPETAVMDTGTGKVVYLEREPGVFDAVRVVVGPLADGYYPVLGGLALGDRVVTQGAFLVDAELRLNPSATAAYFGAAAGPSPAPAGAAEAR